MYSITFYSYKGGVGRTMAMVNVAYDLASRGRRVLMIDFDLEAPGLSTYPELSASDHKPGVVEYVSEYIASLRAPEAGQFIFECKLSTDESYIPLWVMPAGRRDASYTERLSLIDWKHLYEAKSGYLLFEDLKNQLLNDPRRFDYVLIDSRTGHTDVGGICTRQLADSVVLMYFPNRQNIYGLKNIVEEIRSDPSRDVDPISLIFCPSNIPELDDEFGILRDMFDFAREQLEYDTHDVVIQHYSSLSIINQSIFTKDRPRTRLAEEYRALAQVIIQQNIDDSAGALFNLRQARTRVAQLASGGKSPGTSLPSLNETLTLLERIGHAHKANADVSWELAGVYRELGNLPDELAALDAVVESDDSRIEARLRRALSLLGQSRPNEAKKDLIAVLNFRDLHAIGLASAIQALRSIDDSWVQIVGASPALDNVKPSELSIVANALMSDVGGLRIAYRLIEKAIREGKGFRRPNDTLDNDLLLVLIGTGHFAEAIAASGVSRDQAADSVDVQLVFNYSIAEWGLTKIAPQDMLNRVIELSRDSRYGADANFLQCIALAKAATGQVENAVRDLHKSARAIHAGRIFSCWQYLYVSPTVMRRDLDEMEESFSKGVIAPPFFGRKLELEEI